MTKTTRGPAFLRFLEPVLETLKELGGSAKSGEVIDEVVKRLGLSEAELLEQTTSGQSRIRNQIGWARFYLKNDGFIQRSQRGRWTLTPKGAAAKLDEDEVQRVFKYVHERFKKLAEEEEGAAPLPDEEEEESTRDDDSDDGELAGDEDEQDGGPVEINSWHRTQPFATPLLPLCPRPTPPAPPLVALPHAKSGS